MKIKPSKHFVVAGMFRSGTTMMARMLHSNPNIICASDPYAPFFKIFRNKIASRKWNDFDANSPLNDYYFDPDQNLLFQEIQKSDFSLKIDRKEVVELQKRIRSHCPSYSPKIFPFIDSLDGETYEEVFFSGLKILEKAYTKPSATVLGFKEVWINEFAPLIQKTGDQNAKILFIIRDPRAVIASNFSSGATYPLYFLIRQWRKLAVMALHNTMQTNQSRIFLYEDLVAEPEKTARSMCDFLGVEFVTNMIDPESFVDGSGKPWVQNSSYETSSKSNARIFDKSANEKWKKVLSQQVVSTLELFCGFEMDLFGYTRTKSLEKTNFNPISEYEDDQSQFSEWIRPYSAFHNFKEALAEFQRVEMIEKIGMLGEFQKRLLFLHPDIYQKTTL